MRTAAIFGTGLIGSSFGLALRAAGFSGDILGVSSQPAIEAAMRAGAIDQAATLEDAARAADLVFLAQPVRRIIQTLGELNSFVRPDAIITDAGSTKGAITRTAAEHISACTFIGGHPMAGAESRGAEAADANLFQGRTWVLTPAHEADLHMPAAAGLLEWIRRIGARVVVMDPAQHDRTVALSSHLPQLASTALAAALLLGQRSQDISVFGPGLLDMTRLALSPFDLWNDVLATNGEAVASALDRFIEELSLLREVLERGDERELGSIFQQAQQLARQIRTERNPRGQSLSCG